MWRGIQSEQASKLKDELAGPLRVMQEAARRIAKISIESKLPVVEGTSLLRPYPCTSSDILCLSEEYVASFKLMDAVYSWCNGAKFSEICKVRPLSLSYYAKLTLSNL